MCLCLSYVDRVGKVRPEDGHDVLLDTASITQHHVVINVILTNKSFISEIGQRFCTKLDFQGFMRDRS